MKGRFIDLNGQRFGRWTILAQMTNNNKKTVWLCRCDCGTVRVVRSESLRDGRSPSCGCLTREPFKVMNLRHGHVANGRQSSTYNTWKEMIRRCTRSNADNWKHYGGRGISVCDRWKVFDNFLADMGERPLKQSIDRINNDGNYELENCRWATQKEQIHNQRQRKLTA